MARKSSKEELEALVKTTEQNRVQLQKTWQKVENLEAAIQAAKDVTNKIKTPPGPGKPKP